jgi:hypothetical protein
MPMTNIRRFFEDDESAATRRSNSLAALALTLFLVVAGLYLVKTLEAQSATQSCLLSGRLVCTDLQ